MNDEFKSLPERLKRDAELRRQLSSEARSAAFTRLAGTAFMIVAAGFISIALVAAVSSAFWS
jgi:hypothetical protein